MSKRIRVDDRQPAIGSVEVLPGFHFPGGGVTVTDAAHPSGLAVAVDIVPRDGRLVVIDVRASAQEGGAEAVTLAALRTIALKSFVKLAIGRGFNVLAINDNPQPADFEADQHVFWGQLSTRERDRLKTAGPTVETLGWVGFLYRLALLVDEPPTKSLQRGFGVSLRTATNWVAAARRAGLLDITESTTRENE